MPDFTSSKEQTGNPQRLRHTPVHRYLENYILFTTGFRQAEHGLWWEKDGVCYGKEAALQKARQLRH
jgi:hypothetical protein